MYQAYGQFYARKRDGSALISKAHKSFVM
jgi:hypothetical protein